MTRLFSFLVRTPPALAHAVLALSRGWGGAPTLQVLANELAGGLPVDVDPKAPQNAISLTPGVNPGEWLVPMTAAFDAPLDLGPDRTLWLGGEPYTVSLRVDGGTLSKDGYPLLLFVVTDAKGDLVDLPVAAPWTLTFVVHGYHAAPKRRV